MGLLGRAQQDRRSSQVIRFGPYTLDQAHGLRRGKREVRVTPKSLALLLLLAERAGEIVSKQELFRSVWTGIAVSDSALTSCIQELRRALRDDAQQPRFIETLHRRGYRFIAGTRADLSEPLSPAARSFTQEGLFVGREDALEAIEDSAKSAVAGHRQVLFITGEAGIGKTSLVKTFLSKSRLADSARVSAGVCVERYGAAEPYEPVLEALARLCRGPDGDQTIAVLEKCSPDWLVHLPAVLPLARLEALGARIVSGTSNRMLRQLNDGLESLSEKAPLVLWLEDIHWSDTSTLDWLTSFAHRSEPARILLLATFRPLPSGETLHPLAAIHSTLKVKKMCRTIEMTGLDERKVVTYLELRFPPSPESREAIYRLGRFVYRHTGGNPLFVVNIADDLAARQLVVQRDGAWHVDPELNASDLVIPEDVRMTIRHHLSRLQPQALRLLEIASVAGVRFSAAAVAAGAGASVEEAETDLFALTSETPLIREAGSIEWPDGTAAEAFEFAHALYRDVTYDRIPTAVCGQLHRLIGGRKEQGYGDRVSEIAAELALHFEQCRDFRRAGIYLTHAAENARRTCAYNEARKHYEAALQLLEHEPSSKERLQREMRLWNGLGAAIMAIRGWSAPEAAEAYGRARAVGNQVGTADGLFPATFGLWLFYLGKGPLTVAQDLASDLLAHANNTGVPDLLLQASHASWTTAFLQGNLKAAAKHVDIGLRLYDVKRHATMAANYGSHDAKVCGLAFRSWVFTLQGRTREGIASIDEALGLARSLAHPFSVAQTLVFAAETAQARGDCEAVRSHAAAALLIARDQDFRLMAAWASALEGWAEVDLNRSRQALQQLALALAQIRTIGNNSFLPYFFSIHADACLRIGEIATAMETIEAAFTLLQSTGERFWEAELTRLSAVLRLAANQGQADPEIQRLFQRSIEISEGQGARLLSVRAQNGLDRLRRHFDSRSSAQNR